MNTKIGITTAIIAVALIPVASGQASNDWNDSCYDAGYDDGQNGPFADGTWDHC